MKTEERSETKEGRRDLCQRKTLFVALFFTQKTSKKMRPIKRRKLVLFSVRTTFLFIHGCPGDVPCLIFRKKIN